MADYLENALSLDLLSEDEVGLCDISVYDSTASSCKPLSEKHREAIRKVHLVLVQDLDVTDVMDHMIQSNVINDHKRDVILAKPTRQDRVRTFLDILIRSGSNALGVFLEALKNTYFHLWDTLQNQLQPEDEYENCGEDARQYNACSDRLEHDDTDGYSVVIARQVPDDLCFEHSQTMTMVCREACSGIVIGMLQKTVSFSEPFKNYLERPLPPILADYEKFASGANENGETSSSEQPKSVSISEGEFLFLDENESRRIQGSEKPTSLLVRVWDKFGRLLQLPLNSLKMYGDPMGEPWFYPIAVSSQQAELVLKSYKKPGVFLVYKPLAVFSSHQNDNVVFNLSMVTNQGDLYSVLNYHVKGAPGGRVTMFDQMSFSSIHDLVAYYRVNRGRLPCRLRHPPCDVDRIIRPGEHYDMKWHISEDSLDWPDNDMSITWEGEFGTVMQAFKDLMPVAVKFQSPSQRVDPWSLEQFFEEAQIMTKMNHKNVVQLHGFSLTKTPFLVMEYLPGGTLHQALQQKSINQNYANIVGMFKQVLMALQYLESLKFVIHADVAARNILIGEGLCLKLADFGLARMVTVDGYFAEENTKIPVKHSAPEVLIRGWFSTKSDVWSAGVLLWEMLSDGNTRPYANNMLAQIIQFLQSGERLPCPSGHYESTQRFYATVTTKCWMMDEKARPSASALFQVASAHPRQETLLLQNVGSDVEIEPNAPKKENLFRRIKRKSSSKLLKDGKGWHRPFYKLPASVPVQNCEVPIEENWVIVDDVK